MRQLGGGPPGATWGHRAPFERGLAREDVQPLSHVPRASRPRPRPRGPLTPRPASSRSTLSETEPVLDPQLRAIEEEKSKGLLNDSGAPAGFERWAGYRQLPLTPRPPASVFESKGIDCVSHLVLEHTWETVGCAVLDEAKALGVDLLVVASSGKGALKAAFEGSLTSFVVKHATMPVLAFPPPSRWAGV